MQELTLNQTQVIAGGYTNLETVLGSSFIGGGLGALIGGAIGEAQGTVAATHFLGALMGTIGGCAAGVVFGFAAAGIYVSFFKE